MSVSTGSSIPPDLAVLPAVDRVLALPAIADLVATHGRTLVLGGVRAVLRELRLAALAGSLRADALSDEALEVALRARVAATLRPRLLPVFNLTGTVLHTNFGRALLPQSALDALIRSQRAPVTLEFDLATGKRGERDAIVQELLCELCAAEAATVVNNCAAALLLTLGALARRREVIVSRGELIEIGGSFRLPDLMRAAGVKLVEVGTTNRTHIADYAAAVNSRTALILKVHPSNYVISGFTAGVEARELAPLARERAVPLVVDLGSGALIDLTRYGLPAEPIVSRTVGDGADLVLFSGDKLLGGPQSGIVVGRAALIARLNRDSLKRALRPGKLTLAALEAVLTLYRSPENLSENLTTLAQLTRDPESIRLAAERLCGEVDCAVGPAYSVCVEPVEGQIGSGAQPGVSLLSYALAIRSLRERGAGLTALARRLRALERPIIGRLAGDRLLLDLRCLAPGEEAILCAEIGRLRA